MDDNITIDMPTASDSSSDTYNISSGNVSIDTSSILGPYPSYNVGVGAVGCNGATGNYTYTGASSWSNNTVLTTNPSSNTLTVSGDAEFEGSVKIKGHDIVKLLERIEDRFAILLDPDPAKLEKFPALKKAYDHYKLLEKLVGED
jgi:hypothetical protein